MEADEPDGDSAWVEIFRVPAAAGRGTARLEVDAPGRRGELRLDPIVPRLGVGRHHRGALIAETNHYGRSCLDWCRPEPHIEA